VLSQPIDHTQIAPTVAAALGIRAPENAQGGPVLGALAADPLGVETMSFPGDPRPTRDSVLNAAGYTGARPQLAEPAQGVVMIDVAGLYEDDFHPGTLTVELAQNGARFVSFYTRFRDSAVTEYQMLTGTYPSGPTWVPFAEDDPKLD